MCNAFMVFEALHRLGSKADRVLLYPGKLYLISLKKIICNSDGLILQTTGIQLIPTQKTATANS